MKLDRANLTLSNENIKCVCSRKEPEKKEKNHLHTELSTGKKSVEKYQIAR